MARTSTIHRGVVSVPDLARFTTDDVICSKRSGAGQLVGTAAVVCRLSVAVASILASLSCFPVSTEGQVPPVAPPPRIAMQSSVGISFSADASANMPQGDETLVVGTFVLRSRRVEIVGPFEASAELALDLGISYRDDSSASTRLRVEKNALSLDGALRLPIGWHVDPYLTVALATAPTESFRYASSARARIASFWDPVTTTESFGATVVHRDEDLDLQGAFSVALRQIRADQHIATTDDRSTREITERYRAESGIELSGRSVFAIDSGRGRVEIRAKLFGEFTDLSVWSVSNESELSVDIAEHLTFVWRIVVRHDIDETLRTQFESGLSLGVNAPL